jgi:aconitate hydratase
LGLSITKKILKNSLVSGELVSGTEIAVKVDQTLTHDGTGVLAYLQLEAIGAEKIDTELSVSYVDHNLLQNDKNASDIHNFLQSFAARHGIVFSRPGNGICHQVHLERFSVPGKILLGTDSHTPTCGAIGMIAIGAGGLDVAISMAGSPFHMIMPKVVKVELKGKLQPWVSAKDIILEMLSRYTVRGGAGRIFEYCGEGIQFLTVPERGTITNMGAELGATTSIFPSDEQTLAYLTAQGRAEGYQPLAPDHDAEYDEEIVIDLTKLEPLIAKPHSPDNVSTVREVAMEKIQVHQVIIGSCTNSSYMDLMRVAEIVKGKKIHPKVSLAIAPGSKQVFEMIARNGALADLISAGARVLESACGPCIGMGQTPASGSVSLRSFNRNFEGRSGTQDAQVYLSSPEVCAVAALMGEITDPRAIGEMIQVGLPPAFINDDNMVIFSDKADPTVTVTRGDDIVPLPTNTPVPASISSDVILKVGDNISTDHISPVNAKIISKMIGNIPEAAKYCFYSIDSSFYDRAKSLGTSIIIGGANYGQGSSREHSAMIPSYLGVKVVIAKTFARIHQDNLINYGIVPMTFTSESDYDQVDQGDRLRINYLYSSLAQEIEVIQVINETKNLEFEATYSLTHRQLKILLNGGLLQHVKKEFA